MKYLNLFLFFLIFAIFAFSIPVKNLPKKSAPANVVMSSIDKNVGKADEYLQKNRDLNFTKINQKLLDTDLEAKAIYIFDLKTGNEIFGKNTETVFPLASLAKLMTAVIAKETLRDKDIILISEKALAQDGDSGFYLNEKWRAKDLIDIMLVNSSNAAAEALTEAVDKKMAGAEIQKDTIKLMNEKAVKLGMKNTVYFNSTGLDADGKSGTSGSAKDIFLLIDYILKNYPEILQKTREDSFTAYSVNEIPRVFHNTNLFLNQFSQIIYGKTGFTDIAGGNLAIIFDLGFNRPIVLVILGSSFDGRFKNALKITKILYETD